MTTSTTRENKTWYWISIILLLALWELTARLVGKEIIIPSLPSVGKELWKILRSPSAWQVIGGTLRRIGLTFLLDLVLALLLGIPAGLYPKVEQALRPIESSARTVPTMGIALLAIIWLDSEGAPYLVSSLIVFPILYRSVVDGILNMDPHLAAFHRVHRVGKGKTLRHFYIPSLLPFLKTGAIASLGLLFKVMVTAEVLSQPKHAVGTIFQIERSQLNTAAVMAWCVFMIVLSSLFELLIKNLGRLRGRRAWEVLNGN
ncbi:MAG: ABC transporter permease subunit [Spirochaetales bacterium]|nr:ABC transporter permease subunit [Spirochaetales bacterium]